MKGHGVVELWRLPAAPAPAHDPDSLVSLRIRVQGLVCMCPSQEAPWLLQTQVQARGSVPGKRPLKRPGSQFLGTHSWPLTSQLSSIRLLCLAATSW